MRLKFDIVNERPIQAVGRLILELIDKYIPWDIKTYKDIYLMGTTTINTPVNDNRQKET